MRCAELDYSVRAEDVLPGMISLRRAIHAEPELGLFNPRTTEKVKAALAGLPLELRSGPSTSGLVAILRGGVEGRTVLLRGDMDALPLEEATGLEFASRHAGKMHACGHDSHTAMLVGAAQLLCERREHLAGSVMFMFQPGEEGHHGARHMIEDGLLDPLPDAAFALHVMPNAEHGVFAGRPGPLMASADKININVIGRGGHASMPHDALDPVPVACEIVLALQSMVTRKVSIADPAVVTIARMVAGTSDNVVPETAFLHGTLRTLSSANRRTLQERIIQLATGIAAAHGLSAEVNFEPGFPVTLCDDRAVAFGRKVVEACFGRESWQDLPSPVMGAEDFSYVLQKVPGALFFLGAAQAGTDWSQCCALHSNRMILDESVMARGAAVHAALAERFLAEGFGA